ncbi:hypothetical protein Hanom_Chr14g01285031 [Helianthus anomalus]
MARRPDMISKSWLFFELSMYSESISKNRDTSLSSSPSMFRIFITPTRSEP